MLAAAPRDIVVFRPVILVESLYRGAVQALKLNDAPSRHGANEVLVEVVGSDADMATANAIAIQKVGSLTSDEDQPCFSVGSVAEESVGLDHDRRVVRHSILSAAEIYQPFYSSIRNKGGVGQDESIFHFSDRNDMLELHLVLSSVYAVVIFMRNVCEVECQTRFKVPSVFVEYAVPDLYRPFEAFKLDEGGLVLHSQTRVDHRIGSLGVVFEAADPT